jgi:hypothetical protein
VRRARLLRCAFAALCGHVHGRRKAARLLRAEQRWRVLRLGATFRAWKERAAATGLRAVRAASLTETARFRNSLTPGTLPQAALSSLARHNAARAALRAWRLALAHAAWRAQCCCLVVAARRRRLLLAALRPWAALRRRRVVARRAARCLARRRLRVVLTAWRVLTAASLARRWAAAHDGAVAAEALAAARVVEARERAAASFEHAEAAEAMRAEAATALMRYAPLPRRRHSMPQTRTIHALDCAPSLCLSSITHACSAELRAAAAPGSPLLDVPLEWRALRPAGGAPPPSLRPAAAAALVTWRRVGGGGADGVTLLEDIALCDPGSARGGAGAPPFALSVLRRDASASLPADAAGADVRWCTPRVQGAPPRPREHPAACAVGAAASLLFFGGWDGAAELSDAFLLRRLPPDDAPPVASSSRASGAHPGSAPTAPPAPRFAWAGPLPSTGGGPAPRSHATLTPAASGLVYLFGGYRADVGALNELWAARPSRRLGALDADADDDAEANAHASAAAKEDAWADPVALTWHCPDAGGAPPCARSGHAAAAAADGCIYVHGGFDGAAELADLHRFDPASGAWEALAPWGPAPGPRRLHAMAASGRHLLLFGGWDGERDLGDCFALCVDSMTWRRIDAGIGGAGGVPAAMPAPAPRSAHALVTTASGGVLLLGGVQEGRLAREGPLLLENAAAVEGRALRREALTARAAAAEAEAARRRTAAGAAAAAVDAAAARRDAAHARQDAEEAAAARAAAADAQRTLSARLAQEHAARLRAGAAAKAAAREAAALRAELLRRTAALEAAVAAADADAAAHAPGHIAAARAAVASELESMERERDAFERQARSAAAARDAAEAARAAAEMRTAEALAELAAARRDARAAAEAGALAGAAAAAQAAAQAAAAAARAEAAAAAAAASGSAWSRPSSRLASPEPTPEPET